MEKALVVKVHDRATIQELNDALSIGWHVKHIMPQVPPKSNEESYAGILVILSDIG